MEGRMTIGEFSRRCGLSPKVLRSYADIGLIVPTDVDPSSGYRYYETRQLDEAAIVVLLRRAGVPLADIARFFSDPSPEVVDGWERSLVAEVHARRQALAEVRGRLGQSSTSTRGSTMVEIRPVEDRAELRVVFDLLGGEMEERLDTSDFRFRDLDAHFPADSLLMLVAVADGRRVGGVLCFRNDDGWATLRMVAVVEAFRHRGIGRRLLERVEVEARALGVEAIGLGTDGDPVGFYFHLGYTPNLLFQWVYDPDRYGEEAEAVLGGPLAGLRSWRSSFNGVPQLFVELDEPRLDLRRSLQDLLSGAHVGFMMSKRLHAAARLAQPAPSPGR